MDKVVKTEKNCECIEKRTAYTTSYVDWIFGKDDWKNLCCIGVINTQFTTKKGTTNEWYYYISNQKLTDNELLNYARNEWSLESMHWLIDFSEDFCRPQEERTQENLNIIRKIVLNSIRNYKEINNNKASFSGLMFDCLLNPDNIIKFL